MKHKDLLTRITKWYFAKNVLPYWVIVLADAVIVFLSAIITYWFANRTLVTFEHRIALVMTAAVYALLSWVGAWLFKTYRGVLRYSSFVDLLKLGYANAVSLALVLVVSFLAKWQGWEMLSALPPVHTIITFALATTLMWAMRVLVKSMFDAANSDSQAMPVLIYGALTGGIGLAKSIRSQNPVKYELRGFITHEHRIKDMKLMGVKVYTLDDDIAAIIRRERIKAVLVYAWAWSVGVCLLPLRQRVRSRYLENGA